MDHSVAQSAGREPVRQFSVFAPNKVGKLAELCSILAHHQIHPLALSTQDTTDSTIVRFVVDDPEGTVALLEEYDFAYNQNILIAVEMESVTDLRKVLAALMEAEINIHYTYPLLYRPNGRCGLLMNVEDNDLATNILTTRQLKVLTQEDLSR